MSNTAPRKRPTEEIHRISYTEKTGTVYSITTMADYEADPEWYENTIHDIVEGWFQDGPLTATDFFDRLESDLMASERMFLPSDTGTPLMKNLLRIARSAKREIGARS